MEESAGENLGGEELGCSMVSTKRLNYARKFAPRIGWSTSVRRNWNWKQRVPNCRGINLEPNQPLGGGVLSEQLWNDGETQTLKLQCPLNNHSLTGILEGTRDNRGWEGYLIFPPPASSGVSLEAARRATIVGCRTKKFVEITSRV